MEMCVWLVRERQIATPGTMDLQGGVLGLATIDHVSHDST